MPGPSPFAIADFRLYWVTRLASTIAQMIDGHRDRLAGLRHRPRSRRAGHGPQGRLVPARPDRHRPVRAAVRPDPGHRLDRRPARPPRRSPARRSRSSCSARRCSAGCAWTGSTSLPALFAVAALLGVARAFAMPALQALAPNLVPRAILPKAIAMSSIAWQIGRDRRPGDRRLSLRRRAASALCGRPAACSPCRSPACS